MRKGKIVWPIRREEQPEDTGIVGDDDAINEGYRTNRTTYEFSCHMDRASEEDERGVAD